MKGKTCVLVLCLCLLTTTMLLAQTAGMGALTGTITDPSGAVVPSATVTATSIDTAQSRTVMTGADGAYKVSLLPPGNYRVRIEASGFKPVEIPSITVTVTETGVLNRSMELGAQNQAVTVEGEVETVQTASSALGQVVSTRTITALPLSTRNYTNLLAMSAGASSDVVNSARMGKSSADIAMNGANTTQNTYLQDGVSVNNWLSVNTVSEGTLYGADDARATGFGNDGAGNILGPGQQNWDISLTKSTKFGGLREDATLLFRAEFFNAFNHPMFNMPQVLNGSYNPSLDLNSSNFARITTTGVNPRLIQLALKDSF
jgi:Carboxypeptidase regulatory-like domain